MKTKEEIDAKSYGYKEGYDDSTNEEHSTKGEDIRLSILNGDIDDDQKNQIFLKNYNEGYSDGLDDYFELCES